jgi:hypothetical protein
MGIERLNIAAHAAGFAMAAPDEDVEAMLPEARSAAALQWEPSRAILVRETVTDRADWLSVLLGLIGRRTPVRRPALTAEA